MQVAKQISIKLKNCVMLLTDNDILKNLFSIYDSTAKSIGIDYVRKSNYSIISSSSSAWPNIVYRINETDLSLIIDELDRDIIKINASPLLLLEDSIISISLLKSKGYLPIDRWMGMHKVLNTVNDVTQNDSIVCEKLDNRNNLEIFLKVVSRNLFGGKTLDPIIFSNLKQKVDLIAGFENEVIIGTSLIYYDEHNTSGIYMVSVDKAKRGKGIGKILVNYCLNVIKSRGYNKVVLQATKDGVKLYEALDFIKNGNQNLFWKIKK